MGFFSTVKGVFIKPKSEQNDSEFLEAPNASKRDRVKQVRKFIKKQKIRRKVGRVRRAVGVWSKRASERLSDKGGVTRGGFQPHDPFGGFSGPKLRDPFDAPPARRKRKRKVRIIYPGDTIKFMKKRRK